MCIKYIYVYLILDNLSPLSEFETGDTKKPVIGLFYDSQVFG